MYVTDALRIISENTSVSAAHFSAGKSGRMMGCRWVDLGKPEATEDSRTPEEVVEHMLTLLRGNQGHDARL